MKFGCGTGQTGRQLVLLAPGQDASSQFNQAVSDPRRHRRLLAETQRLRGRIYVQDGAIKPRQLSREGQHIQTADALSWHLLAVDNYDRVVACVRYFSHGPGVSFSDLSVSQSAMAESPEFGPRVREAVESEIYHAARAGLAFVEIGGWAISEQLRCTTEAIQMILAAYALGQLNGGALGLSIATTRHNSSSILKRVGARPLLARGEEMPLYFDPRYDCEMELLSFDSSSPNAKYADRVRDCRALLLQVPIVLPEPAGMPLGLLALHAALSDPHETPSYETALQESGHSTVLTP